jgi:hypothetical protein
MWICALAVLAFAGLATVTPPEVLPTAEDAAVEFPAGQRQLFLDDFCVESVEGLTRSMHCPVKKGAVIVPDRAWETTLQTRSAPAWDVAEKCYKLWLLTSTPDPGVAGTTYVESRDGIEWTKPSLGQYEFRGARENNFVTVDPALQWPENAIENVVYDADDPDPGRRYKGFLGCYGRQPIVSPDGIHWRRLPVPELPSQDESNLTYDGLTRTFVATLKQTGPYGRSHTLSTSKDFEHWTEPELVFHADAEDQERAKERIRARLASASLQQTVYDNPADYNADIYNVGLFRYEGLYVALPSVFHCTGKSPTGDTDGFHLIELACSHDLRSWQRLGDRQAFIGPSPVAEGAFDTMQLLPPSAPVVHGDELWFYYTGIRCRVESEEADRKGGAICLAVLRRDGFISMDAGQDTGVLLTKPFAVPGSSLSVNVDATDGILEIAVLDVSGEVLATSAPIVGNWPEIRVRWETGALTDPEPALVKIRFTLHNAKLYSFWADE